MTLQRNAFKRLIELPPPTEVSLSGVAKGFSAPLSLNAFQIQYTNRVNQYQKYKYLNDYKFNFVHTVT